MIKVLIVDDSVVFRKILQEALSKHPRIRVVGMAADGREALGLIRKLRPDLAIMDVEMPRLDGLQTLDEINRRHLKLGVIMFSSLTSKGAKTTLDALAKGAFDFVPKPTGTGAFSESTRRIQRELIPKIEAYAESAKGKGRRKGPLPRTRVVRPGARQPLVSRPGFRRYQGGDRALDNLKQPGKRGQSLDKPATIARPGPLRLRFRPEAVVIGVSTGGPNALNSVIPSFPSSFRLPVFLVQHMPPVFTTQLAKRLDEKSRLRVVEARDRQPVSGGTVYIAPGDYHMEVQSNGTQRIIRLNQNPPENSCRPSVDSLFRSAGRTYGGRVVGVIMTGMGQDGLEGSRFLKEKGAIILAQDKASSVVWGMPRFITEQGLADRVCPLDTITNTILELTGFSGRALQDKRLQSDR